VIFTSAKKKFLITRRARVSIVFGVSFLRRVFTVLVTRFDLCRFCIKKETNTRHFVMLAATHKRPLRKVQSTKPSHAPDNFEVRRVPVPSHRLSPLKEHWPKIYLPVVEHLRLDIRFNIKSRNVEIRNPSPDDAIGSQHLQKAADFVKAFVYGFEVEDALALIRLDNLFVESFEVRIVYSCVRTYRKN